MSTKDLIKRLNRTSPQGSRPTTDSGEADASKDKVATRTRVNNRVIRRRRDKEKNLPAGASLKPSLGGSKVSALRQDLPTRKKRQKTPLPTTPAQTKPAPEATPEVVPAEPVISDEPTEILETPENQPQEEVAVSAETSAEPQASGDSQPSEDQPTTNNADEVAQAASPDTTASDADSTSEATTPATSGPESTTEKKSTDGEKPTTDESGNYVHLGLGTAVIGLPDGYDPNNPVAATPAPTPKPAKRTPIWSKGGGQKQTEADGESTNKDNKRRDQSRRRKTRRFMVGSEDLPAYRSNKRRKRSGPKKASPQAKAIKRRVSMTTETITVTDLAHAMSTKSGRVIKFLLESGIQAQANDAVDYETAQLVATEFEFEIVDARFQEDSVLISVTDESASQAPRDAVVTIMGHVDHGKTTLLDSIRRSNVADAEAGGITQHISAYQVERSEKTITFIDTPGHEAFTAMRARGAAVTDIVVLVVAADDGVMPQTVEALNHAKAADVQIIVAVNKCDKPEATPDRVREELMSHGLVPEAFGGDTIFADVSALNGTGIDDLLDSILLIAEVAEYTADPDRHAEGFVLEARLERGRGVVATLLVKQGTLKKGDSLVLGSVWGRVRALNDYRGKKLKSSGPSTPVEVIGLQELPEAGDSFVVVESDKHARTLAGHRLSEIKASQQQRTAISLEDLVARASASGRVSLNLVLKSDVGGTLEAMKGSLSKIKVEGTDIKVLHSAIGAVSESDVTLAHTYNGIIIGFNVRPDSKARKLVNQLGVEVRSYKVIYEALEDVEKALKGLLAPEIKEAWQGLAELRQTFTVPKVGTVAGCMVTDGKISRNHQIRLLRDGVIIWNGKLASLRRFKDDVREVEKGYECGMNLDGFNDIKVGDVLEAFTMEEVSRT